MKNFHLYKLLFLLVFFSQNILIYSQNENIELLEEKNTETTNESSSTTSKKEAYIPKIITYVDSPIIEQRKVFTKDEIEKKHSESLSSFLQSTGIQILSYGSYGLESKPSIRGFTDETIRVIIDGVCVNNAQYGTFDFSSININEIEKIEIIKGGFSEQASTEGAVGGSIIITTKKQTLGHIFSLDTAIKSFFYEKSPLDSFSQNIGYSGQLSDNTYLATNLKGTFAKNAYPFINYKNNTFIRKNAQIFDTQSNIKLSHFFGSGNNWNISNTNYYGNKEIPGTELSNNFGTQKDINNNLNIGIIFPSIKDSIKFNSNASWLSSTRFYEDYSEDSKHYVNSFILSSSIDFFEYSNITQSCGSIFNFTSLNSTNDGIHNLFSGTISETTKISINKVFSIVLPLSFKFSGENIALIPKIGIKTNLNIFNFILNFYRMVQFPNMDDLYWGNTATASGNPNLKKEDGWGTELVINSKNKFLPFSFCAYSNYYQNKIQWSSNEYAKWSPQNIASAFYIGLDVSIEKTIFDFITAQLNFEYLYNKLLDKSNSLTYGNRIMWTPDFLGNFSISIDTKYVLILTEINYVGKKYISNLNTDFIEPYYLINIQANFNFWNKIKPYLKLENILDVDYESVPNYPMPGISCTIGIKCNF